MERCCFGLLDAALEMPRELSPERFMGRSAIVNLALAEGDERCCAEECGMGLMRRIVVLCTSLDSSRQMVNLPNL